jgi:plasminogen activator inhibitor 1 RNA-binding protein
LGEEEEATQTTTKLTRNEKKVIKNNTYVDNSRATPGENRLRNDYPKRGGFAGKSSRPARSSEGSSNRRRGGRGEYKGRGREFDRHSGSARRDSQKKDVAGKGSWGKPTENLEEVVEVEQENNANGEEEVKETKPEEKLMTLNDYLASQAKKAIVNENTIRTANEGVDESKWGETVELSKDEEAYFVGKGNEKSHRVKKQKEKTYVYEIEQRFNDGRRGRGGRQNRGSNSKRPTSKVNVDDTNDFPSLK